LPDLNVVLNVAAPGGTQKLEYLIQSDPNPIRASPTGANPWTIDLRIVISSRDPSITTRFKSLSLSFPIGQDLDGFLSGDKELPQPVKISSGAWSVSRSRDGNGVQIKPDPASGLIVMAGDPLIFSLRGIHVGTKEGRVQIDITETPETGDKTTGVVYLEKLRSSFPVASFVATPGSLYIPDKVRLSWKCTDEGKNYSYQLSSSDGRWKPRDCQGAGDCFTCSDGDAGVMSPALNQATEFLLTVISASDGRRVVEKTLSARVGYYELSLSNTVYLKTSPSGRLVKLGWSTRNATRCEVLVDGEVVDANAPLNTAAPDDRYCMFLAGPDNKTFTIDVKAYGQYDATAQVSLGKVQLKVLRRLTGEIPFHLEIDTSGKYALLQSAMSARDTVKLYDIASGAESPIKMDVKPKLFEGYLFLAGIAFSPSGSQACLVNTLGQELVLVDIAERRSTQIIPMAPRWPLQAFYSHSGEKLIVSFGTTSATDGEIAIVDVKTGKIGPSVPVIFAFQMIPATENRTRAILYRVLNANPPTFGLQGLTIGDQQLILDPATIPDQPGMSSALIVSADGKFALCSSDIRQPGSCLIDLTTRRVQSFPNIRGTLIAATPDVRTAILQESTSGPSPFAMRLADFQTGRVGSWQPDLSAARTFWGATPVMVARTYNGVHIL